MRIGLAVHIVTAGTLVGCDGVDQGKRLQSVVAMPACSNASITEANHQNFGLTDYRTSLSVTVTDDCMARWQANIKASPAYWCSGSPKTCGRYEDIRNDTDERATVTFVSTDRAIVELDNL